MACERETTIVKKSIKKKALFTWSLLLIYLYKWHHCLQFASWKNHLNYFISLLKHLWPTWFEFWKVFILFFKYMLVNLDYIRQASERSCHVFESCRIRCGDFFPLRKEPIVRSKVTLFRRAIKLWFSVSNFQF